MCRHCRELEQQRVASRWSSRTNPRKGNNMTGYQSKKAAANAKLEQAKEILLQHPQKDIDWQREQQIKAHTKLNDDDDDTQVYKDHGDALTIAYQSGYYDGKQAALAGREWNFCERCGKRTADLTTIHTCTPPQGLNSA